MWCVVANDALLQRLDEMVAHLKNTEGTLLLLGLGSIGAELARLDAYSDLDFFLIVEDGYKQRFIQNLDWLDAVHPLAYHFQNTVDGHKILYTDGIYAEFAVFEYGEMSKINYSGGRIVWKRDTFDASTLPMQNGPALNGKQAELDYCLNEALTNLYVGITRYARGEKLNATFFVESYALSHVLKVLHLLEPEQNEFVDRYGLDRRLEVRHPAFAERLPQFMQGYSRVPESVLAILAFLEEVYPINSKMAEKIRMYVEQVKNKSE